MNAQSLQNELITSLLEQRPQLKTKPCFNRVQSSNPASGHPRAKLQHDLTTTAGNPTFQSEQRAGWIVEKNHARRKTAAIPQTQESYGSKSVRPKTSTQVRDIINFSDEAILECSPEVF